MPRIDIFVLVADTKVESSRRRSFVRFTHLSKKGATSLRRFGHEGISPPVSLQDLITFYYRDISHRRWRRGHDAHSSVLLYSHCLLTGLRLRP
ncbi:hypothetical protein KC19_VG256600 [Ceratodon purpureus]|uniref:Uncharacterized protein n=1 Tax=Ceratodon purpureus TaxID=3225 RepID=A0A8T0HU32_CERPU|nr:hypothetical protein KC19_VG256600 [Ceratodon purpureus]